MEQLAGQRRNLPRMGDSDTITAGHLFHRAALIAAQRGLFTAGASGEEIGDNAIAHARG